MYFFAPLFSLRASSRNINSFREATNRVILAYQSMESRALPPLSNPIEKIAWLFLDYGPIPGYFQNAAQQVPEGIELCV